MSKLSLEFVMACEKCMRNLGERQNISEILGYLRYFRIFRRRGKPVNNQHIGVKTKAESNKVPT